jgi:hypothetical protein
MAILPIALNRYWGANRYNAFLGALIALALVPFAPPGVPILAAAVASLLGLGRP